MDSNQGRRPLLVLLLLLLLLGLLLCQLVAGQQPQDEDFLNDKEKKVQLLAHHALFLQLAAEANDCGLSNCVDKCSRHSCSPTQKDHFSCVQAPRNVTDCKSSGNGSEACLHIKVDFTGNGFVRVPPQFRNYSNLSPELTRAICSQSNLQFPASSETIFTELTFWNYFGSAEGAWRIYPGREADPLKGCIEYDPRKRPWYITATSVVKDLVVLLDTGQVSESTFVLSQNVLKEFFSTFTVGDRVNVATFNATRATLQRPTSIVVHQDQPPDLLYNTFEISRLTNSQRGLSNITGGLAQASAAFNSTSKLKMVVVVTDGSFARNGFSNDAPALQHVVASLSSQGVMVFFFVLDASNATSATTLDPLAELRALSCLMNNSTVTRVDGVDAQRNPLWAIRPFFDYQAALRFTANRTFWTDTYHDFDGLGLVATVTYPVMSEGILYGVAGIDVVVNSDAITTAIAKRLVDANVASVPLPCQLNQVNLSKCSRPVEAHDQALCPQTAFKDQAPTDAFLQNLCCSSCSFRGPPKRDLTLVLVASILPGPLVLLTLVFSFFLLKRRAAQLSIRETKEDFARQSIATNQYTYKELKAATQKFHIDKKLGEGGFGEVYQGSSRTGLWWR